jgi:anaerobic selenocysteine-containing dehydrogenase
MAILGQDILSAANPAIEGIWCNGANVVNQALNSRQIAKAFEQAPFKVVVDAFFNDTARRADLILPAALMLEQEDLIGSFFHDFV